MQRSFFSCVSRRPTFWGHRQGLRVNPVTRCLQSTLDYGGMEDQPNVTAGIIIIGDEIVKGKVRDTNSHFLSAKLFSLGVDVKRITVIPDDCDVIAEEVALFSKRFTHVITAGGIGPTHDDITYQAVAKGLGEDLTLLPQLVDLIRRHFKIDQPKDFDAENPPTYSADVDASSFHPALKMALVPTSSRLHYNPDSRTSFPVVQAGGNILILPGIPQYMERSAGHLETLCRNPGRTYHTRALYLVADEVQLAPILNYAVSKHRLHVNFGSYPVIGHNNAAYHSFRPKPFSPHNDPLPVSPSVRSRVFSTTDEPYWFRVRFDV